MGDKIKYDFLPEMSRVVKVTANETLRIRISRVVEIYKRMCGVNLREKGRIMCQRRMGENLRSYVDEIKN